MNNNKLQELEKFITEMEYYPHISVRDVLSFLLKNWNEVENIVNKDEMVLVHDFKYGIEECSKFESEAIDNVDECKHCGQDRRVHKN